MDRNWYPASSSHYYSLQQRVQTGMKYETPLFIHVHAKKDTFCLGDLVHEAKTSSGRISMALSF